MKRSRVWQLEADEELLEHLRQLLKEQTDQLAQLEAAGAPQESQEAVRELMRLYERALRQAEEQALFHQKTLSAEG